MVAFRPGKKAFLKLVHHGSTFIASSGMDASELDRLCETYDVTVYGNNGDKAFISGLRSAAVKGGGPWASTFDTFLSLCMGSTAAVAFTYAPASTAAGQSKFTGNLIIKNTSINAPAAGRIAWTFDSDVTGAIVSTHY